MTPHTSPDGGRAELAALKMNPAEPVGLTRRQFLKKAAVAGGAMAGPFIVPAAVLGRGGAVAPSERMVTGAIGVGGRGGGDLGWMLQEPDVQVVAVCDVQRARLEAAKKAVDGKYGNTDCAAYRDMRALLAERADIDAVLIAIGDRWHAVASILAMSMGKDVYSEKPSTMTVAEGQALVAAAKRFARIFQTGTQRRSEALFVFADELARTGRLGKIHTVRAHTLPFEMRTDWLRPEPEPSKDEFDWNLWLGPAPWRAYNHEYIGNCMTWLNFYDFGTGVAGWCSHTIAQVQGAIDADLTSAVEYEYPNNTTAEGLVARYANGVRLVLHINAWRGSCGVRYEGTEGWVATADGYAQPDVSAPALLRDSRKLMSDYTARTGHPQGHMRDFLNAVRSRGRCVAHEEVMHRTMTTNHIMDICMDLKRNAKWDPGKEAFVGDEEANRLRSRALRAPWLV